jgi:hypothetical protein
VLLIERIFPIITLKKSTRIIIFRYSDKNFLGNIMINDINDSIKDISTPSKLSLLAQELRSEKKRLQQDLDELQSDYDDVKPMTPTGTPDWYVKWTAMLLGVAGIFTISAGFVVWGQVAYLLSSCGWVYVGMQWSDRAIMIGSAISGTAVLMNMVTGI